MSEPRSAAVPVLSLEAVSARRGRSSVVQGVSLAVAEGEVVALLGPSGSGKSTLVRLLLGLMVPERGAVRIRGELASEPGKLRLRPEERDLSVVFQDLALWPHLTVAGNLRFVLRARRISRDSEDERIAAMLARVGLASSERRYPGELSGGEQQRVAIARALVGEPSAVLLDEPLANLDLALKAELLELLRALLVDSKTAALYVTHDPRELAGLARRIAVLERGRLVQQGTPDTLRRQPATPFVRRVIDELPTSAEVTV